jgi:hypothetical protein
MARVRRPIDPSDFSAIPRMREVIKTLPKHLHICPKHGEEVTIGGVGTSLLVRSGSRPLPKLIGSAAVKRQLIE